MLSTRKSLLVLVVLLLVLLSSCSDYRPVRFRYEAEKRLLAAEKMFNDADVKREVAVPAVAANLKRAYGDVLDYCYNALDSVNRATSPKEWEELSAIAFPSATRVTRLLFADRHYDSCVALLQILTRRATLPSYETAALRVNLGQALQAVGNWEEAVRCYNDAVGMLNPPVDPRGQIVGIVFGLPAHIFRIYQKVGDTVSAETEYRRAVQYYQRLISIGSPRSAVTIMAHTKLASLHADKRQWAAAIQELSQLVDSAGKYSLDAQVRIADIYAGELARYDTALSTYQRLQSTVRGADTAVIPVLIFKQSLVYMALKQYERVRELLTDLNHRYRGYYAANSAAQYLKARSFDDEGNWDRAEAEYRFLIDNYVGSEEAMSSYVYLGDEMIRRGRRAEADRWMDKADAYYQRTIDRSPESPAAARAYAYRADLLRRSGDLAGAARMLTSIFDKFPDTEVGLRSLVSAVGMYRDKLGSPGVADSLLASVKRKLINIEQPMKLKDLQQH